ncbi:hypothetical protein CDEST_08334 [Colletotrichum destructivum]|uniref:Uncharacterized protein n=1 Tax=Colletotrichum destructivum TaxID=34406 RepID=A0AAX4IIL3_9PEZI|nr:hypothetical protein CDEST_08334 [Colletotrichum destructivum]
MGKPPLRHWTLSPSVAGGIAERVENPFVLLDHMKASRRIQLVADCCCQFNEHVGELQREGVFQFGRESHFNWKRNVVWAGQLLTLTCPEDLSGLGPLPSIVAMQLIPDCESGYRSNGNPCATLEALQPDWRQGQVLPLFRGLFSQLKGFNQIPAAG